MLPAIPRGSYPTVAMVTRFVLFKLVHPYRLSWSFSKRPYTFSKRPYISRGNCVIHFYHLLLLSLRPRPLLSALVSDGAVIRYPNLNIAHVIYRSVDMTENCSLSLLGAAHHHSLATICHLKLSNIICPTETEQHLACSSHFFQYLSYCNQNR